MYTWYIEVARHPNVASFTNNKMPHNVGDDGVLFVDRNAIVAGCITTTYYQHNIL